MLRGKEQTTSMTSPAAPASSCGVTAGIPPKRTRRRYQNRPGFEGFGAAGLVAVLCLGCSLVAVLYCHHQQLQSQSEPRDGGAAAEGVRLRRAGSVTDVPVPGGRSSLEPNRRANEQREDLAGDGDSEAGVVKGMKNDAAGRGDLRGARGAREDVVSLAFAPDSDGAERQRSKAATTQEYFEQRHGKCADPVTTLFKCMEAASALLLGTRQAVIEREGDGSDHSGAPWYPPYCHTDRTNGLRFNGNVKHPNTGNCSVAHVCLCRGTPLGRTQAEAVVAPWNGYAAALSSSWDDGSDSQVTYVPTLLSSYNITGTFYLSPRFLDPVDDMPTPDQLPDKWDFARRNYFPPGRPAHEVAAHTLSHENFANWRKGRDEVRRDFAEVDRRLRAEFASAGKLLREPFVMSWPFGEVSNLSASVARERGYVSGRTTKCGYIPWGEQPADWMALPSCQIMGNEEMYHRRVVDDAVNGKTWLIVHGHGVRSCEEVGTDWKDTRIRIKNTKYKNQGVAKGRKTVEAVQNSATGDVRECRHGWAAFDGQTLLRHVQYIAKVRDKADLWVAPVGDVSRYLLEALAYDISAEMEAGDNNDTLLLISATLRDGATVHPNPVPLALEIGCESSEVDDLCDRLMRLPNGQRPPLKKAKLLPHNKPPREIGVPLDKVHFSASAFGVSAEIFPRKERLLLRGYRPWDYPGGKRTLVVIRRGFGDEKDEGHNGPQEAKIKAK